VADAAVEGKTNRLPNESPDGIWTTSEGAGAVTERVEVSRERSRGSFRLNAEALSTILYDAPHESPRRTTGAELSLPTPDGKFSRFRAEESPIVVPGREAGSSRIRTYRLSGVDDPTATGRLSWTGSRLHALVLSERDDFFVFPRSREDDRFYSSTDGSGGGEALRCGVGGQKGPSSVGSAVGPTLGGALRVYRLAVAATAQYTARVSGNAGDPATAKELAYEQIVATVNAADAVYERDLAIRFVLLPKQEILKIIYTDPLNQPYTSGDTGLMIAENQQNLDTVILSANYDVGHVFDDCSGGLSGGIGIVCTSGFKARGVSGGVCETESFKFQTHYLIHEGAHQLGAPHTLNYQDPNGQYDPNNAYEPGSGSTIMSYAGCPPDVCVNESLQVFPDRYFHTNSIGSVDDYVTNGGGACYVLLPTGDHSPDLSAGSDFTIPKHTPFRLTATASDTDGDSLLYCWEEYDLGAPNPPNNDADGQERPILRSFAPVPSPSRIFPSLAYILLDSNDPPEFYQGVDKDNNPRTYLVGESLPNIGRTMTFRVTARDGRGGVATDDMLLTVDGNSGPFKITAPNSPTVWPAGSTQTVTWEVAGSADPPVSCANVDILLSVNDGLTFPIVLAGNTPNDGAQTITVPADASTFLGRVEVKCSDNIFFDVSDEDIVINQSPEITCPADLIAANDPGQCGAVVQFEASVSDDQSDISVSCVPASGSFFPKGTTHVTCTATDPYGASDTCGFDVTVLDAEGPAISSLSVTPSVLRPPNHKMVSVSVAVSVADNCDSAVGQSCHITSIASNEPVEGTGDGDRSPDWEITGALTANLRAERAGNGPGRTYTITVECTDAAGNTASRASTVKVPHN